VLGFRTNVAATACVAALATAGCGDDGDGGAGGTTATGQPGAEEIAACAEDAGFDPTIDDGVESGATAIDLTTETATIVVHVFASAEDAAAYAPKSTLDAEQIGSVLILGGAIPPAERQKIVDCINA
jgi:hypothetical protein